MNKLDIQILKIYGVLLWHHPECPECAVKNSENQFYHVSLSDMIHFKCISNKGRCASHFIMKSAYEKIKKDLVDNDTLKYLINKVDKLEEKMKSTYEKIKKGLVDNDTIKYLINKVDKLEKDYPVFTVLTNNSSRNTVLGVFKHYDDAQIMADKEQHTYIHCTYMYTNDIKETPKEKDNFGFTKSYIVWKPFGRDYGDSESIDVIGVFKTLEEAKIRKGNSTYDIYMHTSRTIN